MPFKISSRHLTDSTVDVVFVHGLRLFRGVPRTDWRFGRGGRFAGPWPKALENDVEGVRVGYLSYDAPASNWFGRAMHLKELAENLLDTLHENGIGDRPIVFVTHSLGGLVVKELLLQSKNRGGNHGRVANQCLGVVFLATPHDGAHIADLVQRLKVIRPSRAIRHLLAHNVDLTYLRIEYANWVLSRGDVEHLVLRETQKVGRILVVPEYSANPVIPDVRVVPINANHSTIASPRDRRDQVYTEVEGFLKNATSRARKNAAAAEKKRRRNLSKKRFLKLDSDLPALRRDEAALVKRRDVAELADNMPEVGHANSALTLIETEIKQVEAELQTFPEEVRLAAAEKKSRRTAKQARHDAELNAAEDELWSPVFGER